MGPTVLYEGLQELGYAGIQGACSRGCLRPPYAHPLHAVVFLRPSCNMRFYQDEDHVMQAPHERFLATRTA